MYDVSTMHNKFRSCTVDVQEATMIYKNPRANRVIGVSA